MGVSILSGTITTLGCGISLFGGKLITFQKFAVIITSTISISFLSAMLLFGALCHVFGPQNNFGNICCCIMTSRSGNADQGKAEGNQMRQLPQQSGEKEEKSMVIEDL